MKRLPSSIEDYHTPIKEADKRVVPTRVTDGILTIDFIHGTANNPMISALEIVLASDSVQSASAILRESLETIDSLRQIPPAP